MTYVLIILAATTFFTFLILTMSDRVDRIATRKIIRAIEKGDQDA